MQTRTVLLFAVSLALCAPALAAGDLTVAINDGRVTVVAQNVPLRQILAEWSRVGQTKIVGAERLAGAPVTIQLEDVPERQALETLLRSVSGYMAAPRPEPVANASVYDRILILPTSSAPAATASAAPAGRSRGPVLAPQPAPAAEDFEQPDVAPETLQEMQQAQEESDHEAAAGVNPYTNARPETQFDYANPQLMLQRRQQMLQQQQEAVSPNSATPGTIMPVQQPQTPNVFPGTVMPPQQPQAPQRVPGAVPNTTAARPGEIIAPPPTVMNPYGLPAGVQPGSAQSPAVQPDRSKYLNPYQPQPPKPPGEQ
jgi:hypothetical protein